MSNIGLRSTSMHPLLTAAQVGRLLSISRRQVLRLGLTRVILGPRTIRFQKEDVDEYIKEKAKDN